MKSFLIITAFTVHIKSKVIYYETSSNASQFIDLENLIGSVHRYMPKSAHIFVRDFGLTKGQRMLLKLYQNVTLISSTYIIPTRTKLIHAEKEIVIIDDVYNERQNNGNFLYADSILKRFQLAIVIPFIRSQLSNLKNQLKLSKIYPPCENPSNMVDLIFYHNEGRLSSLQMEIRAMKYFDKCYRNIRYFAINLTNEENQYPIGSFIMWKKLLANDENNVLSLRTYGYTHFFLMEPDTRPIRFFWLDAIINQITNGRLKTLYFANNWWISGSVYRGSKPIGQRFLHINGNALYHLSASFIAYVQFFSQDYLTEQNSRSGYDLIMFSLLLSKDDLGKRLWHKFQFSDFIQNCWHTGCEGSDQLNNTQFIFNNPNTYLIHGNFVNDEIGEQNVTIHNWIVILSIIVVLTLLLQYHRFYQRLKLNRILRFFYS